MQENMQASLVEKNKCAFFHFTNPESIGDDFFLSLTIPLRKARNTPQRHVMK